MVKDRQNPFDAYSEEEFIMRYCLSKECICGLIGEVEPHLPSARDGRCITKDCLFLLLTCSFVRQEKVRFGS